MPKDLRDEVRQLRPERRPRKWYHAVGDNYRTKERCKAKKEAVDSLYEQLIEARKELKEAENALEKIEFDKRKTEAGGVICLFEINKDPYSTAKCIVEKVGDRYSEELDGDNAKATLDRVREKEQKINQAYDEAQKELDQCEKERGWICEIKYAETGNEEKKTLDEDGHKWDYYQEFNLNITGNGSSSSGLNEDVKSIIGEVININAKVKFLLVDAWELTIEGDPGPNPKNYRCLSKIDEKLENINFTVYIRYEPDDKALIILKQKELAFTLITVCIDNTGSSEDYKLTINEQGISTTITDNTKRVSKNIPIKGRTLLDKKKTEGTLEISLNFVE